MVEIIVGEYFNGPQAIGERCFDILCCCDASHGVLEDMAADKSLSMPVRANALYMVDECDEGKFAESVKEDWDHPDLGEVYRWMTESNDDDEPKAGP